MRQAQTTDAKEPFEVELAPDLSQLRVLVRAHILAGNEPRDPIRVLRSAAKWVRAAGQIDAR